MDALSVAAWVHLIRHVVESRLSMSTVRDDPKVFSIALHLLPSFSVHLSQLKKYTQCPYLLKRNIAMTANSKTWYLSPHSEKETIHKCLEVIQNWLLKRSE